MEIHQVAPALIYGDAVSNNTIALRETFRSMGYKSEIYSKWIDPEVSAYARPLNKYRGKDSNLLFYHYPLAGGEVTEFVKQLPDRKVLVYHNITPPEFYYRYDKLSALQCAEGLKEIQGLAGHFPLALGVSEFNRQALEEFGFENTGVLPIFSDFGKFNAIEDDISDHEAKNGNVNFLFVGRLAPNKCYEDIIKSFFCYNRYINRNSRLHLVGSTHIKAYTSHLQNLVKGLDLEDSVVFAGKVKDDELADHYRNADIFLCMSEHEGFCVPLLEAMHFHIPIVAYRSTGIPYTLGDSGVLVGEKNYIKIAELINVVLQDRRLKARIVERQDTRLKDFDRAHVREKISEIIDTIHLEIPDASKEPTSSERL
jgi:glycosyltransferase involved in cell wall biosynthesis